MSEKAAKRPWHVGGIFFQPEEAVNVWSEPEEGNASGEIVCMRIKRVDAELIVGAVNEHDALKAEIAGLRQTLLLRDSAIAGLEAQKEKLRNALKQSLKLPRAWMPLTTKTQLTWEEWKSIWTQIEEALGGTNA